MRVEYFRSRRELAEIDNVEKRSWYAGSRQRLEWLRGMRWGRPKKVRRTKQSKRMADGCLRKPPVAAVRSLNVLFPVLVFRNMLDHLIFLACLAVALRLCSFQYQSIYHEEGSGEEVPGRWSKPTSVITIVLSTRRFVLWFFASVVYGIGDVRERNGIVDLPSFLPSSDITM
jgi:hypothetical protein